MSEYDGIFGEDMDRKYLFHDFYDLIFFILLAVKVFWHCFETYQLFRHRNFIDNQSKPVIVYLHVTSILMILDNCLWVELNHLGAVILQGNFIAEFLAVPSTIYLKGFWLYCFIFQSHMTIFVCISVFSLIGYSKKTSSYEVFRYYNLPILITGILLPVLYIFLVLLTHFRWMRPRSIIYDNEDEVDEIRFDDFDFYNTHLLFIGCGVLLVVASECVQVMLIVAREEWSRLVLRAVHIAAAFITWMLLPMVEILTPEDYSNLTATFTLYSCFILFLVQMLGQMSD